MYPFSKTIIINDLEYYINFSSNEFLSIENFIEFAKSFQEFIGRKEDFFKINLNITLDINQPMMHSASLLHDDEKSIVLHKLRPFVLQNEMTYLPKIANLFSKEITNQLVRKYLKQQKDNFMLKETKQNVLLYSYDLEKNINSEYIFNLWLNAHEYHKEESKRSEFKKLSTSLPNDVIQYFMHETILRKTNSILNLLKLAENILIAKRIDINIITPDMS